MSPGVLYRVEGGGVEGVGSWEHVVVGSMRLWGERVPPVRGLPQQGERCWLGAHAGAARFAPQAVAGPPGCRLHPGLTVWPALSHKLLFGRVHALCMQGSDMKSPCAVHVTCVPSARPALPHKLQNPPGRPLRPLLLARRSARAGGRRLLRRPPPLALTGGAAAAGHRPVLAELMVWPRQRRFST